MDASTSSTTNNIHNNITPSIQYNNNLITSLLFIPSYFQALHLSFPSIYSCLPVCFSPSLPPFLPSCLLAFCELVIFLFVQSPLSNPSTLQTSHLIVHLSLFSFLA
ncbi:MAG: hypothetical protein BYD32DRAFT_403807 [Podila humilis]|nr:MAG: hypothetical protein BYD32DRAFT_403807 [Podila humilis]